MYNLSLKDTYDTYKENSKTKLVNKVTYLKIVGDFMKFISKLILEGNRVALPATTGSFQIIGRDMNMEACTAVDWKTTKQLWANNPEAKEAKRLIYFTNEHSDFKIYKLQWIKKIADINNLYRNKKFYKFKHSRANNRAKAQYIKGGSEYQIIQTY